MPEPKVRVGYVLYFFTAVGFTLGFFSLDHSVFIIAFRFGKKDSDRTGKRGEKGRDGAREEMRRKETRRADVRKVNKGASRCELLTQRQAYIGPLFKLHRPTHVRVKI